MDRGQRRRTHSTSYSVVTSLTNEPTYLNQMFSQIKRKYPWILRNFWTPVVKSQNLTENKYISKFGGSNPLRGSNFQWPKCGKVHGDDEKVCGLQKFFICQINISDLPDEMKNYIGMDSGMFQIFHCRENVHKLDLDLRIIPKNEMIPSLKTIAALNVFKKNLNTNELPVNLIKFVEDTNEKFNDAMYKKYDSIRSQKESQVQMWTESEAKEIPSNNELRSMAIDDQILQSAPRYGYQEKDSRFLIKDSIFHLTRQAIPLHPWSPPVKLFGYIKDMAGYRREHYPQCLDCGLPKNIVFLSRMKSSELDFSITLCPGCGKPGSVPE